ncbi:MAG: hypothetical protein V1929_04065 [bacterium]
MTGQPTTSRRIPLAAFLVIAAALLLHAPSLGHGFEYDDFIHQYLLRYAMDWPDAGPWRLYDYSYWVHASRDHATTVLAPWWVSPDFKLSFFRPLSSLSIWADYQLYHGWAPGYHATNLAAFALLLLLTFQLFLELGVPRRAALWALAFLAFNGNHALLVGWIANRNEVLASLLTVAMMISLCRHGRMGGRARLAAAAVLFLCACMAKESGLIGLPLAGLYLFTIQAPPSARGVFARCSHVARSPVAWVFGLVTVVYLTGYVLAGHGSFSANYATPLHRSGAYFARMASLLPLATGSLFFGIATDVVFTRPQLHVPVLALSSALFLLLLRIGWRWLRAVPAAWFAAGWVVAALVPMAGVTLSDRLLMSASIGSSLAMGLLMHELGGWGGVRGNLRERWPGLLFVVTGLLVAIPAGLLRGEMFHRMAAADRSAISAMDIDRRAGASPTVVLLNSPSSLLALTMSPTWAVTHDDPATPIYMLNIARRPVTFLWEDPQSVVMRAGDPPLLAHRYERVFHTREEPPQAGTVFETPAFSATVLQTGSEGIRSVRFAFKQPLDGAALEFMAWQDGGYRRVAAPDTGANLELPRPEPTVRWVP